MPGSGVPLPPLLRLSRALHADESLEKVLDRVSELLVETTRYRWTYVHLIHPDGKTMEITGWALPHVDKIRASIALVDVSHDAFVQRVLDTSDVMVVPDIRNEPDADQRQVEATGIRTAIVAPMFDGDARLGPLVVCTFAEEGPLLPTPEELDLITQIAALVGTVITRLRAREAQAKAEARLARAAKAEALGRMAGEVAHDFNNVLLAIVANLELARGELEGHPAEAYLEDALAASQRAATLTRQLLATSRGQPLVRRSVELGRVLTRASKIVAPTLGPTQTLERIFTPEMPTVVGDEEMLERVFVNLFVNARDALGPTGRISVEVRSVHVDGEYVAAQSEIRTGDYALVIVADDGKGMDQDTLARAFDPFFTTKGPEHGTGLGLSVVQGITQQHDGYVNVYSEVGQGTTFKIYLPLADGAPRAEAPPVAKPASLRGDERILVTDDDAYVRKSLERVLTRQGYRVAVAGSELEALALLAERDFDLLLTDVVFSVGNGPELAEKARKLRPGLRILFMTGYTRSVVHSLSGPALMKPFSVNDLFQALRRVLAQESSDATDP